MNQNKATRRVSFQTVGCRLNQYETERMAADLHRYGFRRVGRGEAADLYIINTCTVTHRADSDCRYLIRKAARQNPEARIVVAGCFVDKDAAAVEQMEQVHVVIRNREKDSMTKLLAERLPEMFSRQPIQSDADHIAEFYDHNRAWIKVSDGCNQRCSYCILPRVRGPLNNRPAGEIIDEINDLVEHGYEEVVVTGINLGMYKDRNAEPPVNSLAGICRCILDQTDLRRLRLSSVEPQTIRPDLIQTYAEANGRICRHWHIPLQSGSDRILKLMRRPYDRNRFMRLLGGIRESVPGTIIGADVIVGFPGETEEDFEQSRQVCKSGLIDYLHVFSYSDRPGTYAAEELAEKVNPEVIKARNGVLTAISKNLRLKANQRQIGKVLQVISEHRTSTDNTLWAISDNYVRARMPDGYESSRRIVDFRVTAADLEGVSGDPVIPVI